MGKKKNKELREKGVNLKNNATNVLLPSVINNTILIESTLVVLLATLGEPTDYNISLYRTLLCTLLLSIALGVLCTSIIAIDFYILGNKVLGVVKKRSQKDNHESENVTYIRTGKFFLYSIILTFSSCLILFLISLYLLVKYAW
jgi:hypothetical protein